MTAHKRVSKHTMNKIEKGTTVILGLFDGTSVAFGLSKDKYPGFARAIKEGGREQLARLLPEFGTKEAVAEALYEQMVEMHNKILAISSFVDDDVLERAWGGDLIQEKTRWFLNISTLLHLKRIKNDDMYGWLLMDHNSSVIMNDQEGPTIMVAGPAKDDAKLKKKAQALASLHKKK